MVAESIYIQVPECEIEGWARVLGIGKCPQISPRPGPEFQLVTATFKHHAKQILDVYIAGEKESLGTTPNHPFWSEDQQKFIRADELTPGEHVQKADGTLTTITKIVPRSGANTVYNLEVQLNHTYHVGKTGVLVHNSGTCLKVYHGTDVDSALHFMNGGKLNSVAASTRKIDGPDGFFLANHIDDTEFFARRRSGTIIEFTFSENAQKQLRAANVIQQKIPNGKFSRYNGDELIIQTDNYDIFNRLIKSGDIKITPAF